LAEDDLVDRRSQWEDGVDGGCTEVIETPFGGEVQNVGPLGESRDRYNTETGVRFNDIIRIPLSRETYRGRRTMRKLANAELEISTSAICTTSENFLSLKYWEKNSESSVRK
jgi:hypothetical protein